MMLAELPPTPASAASTSAALPAAPLHPTTSARPQSPPPRSPRKSPAKRKVSGRVASGKKTRVSRRSSGLGLSPTKKVIPPFETEVIPSSIQIPGFKASISIPPSQPPIAAPVFVLPPPSPGASLRKHVPPETDAPQRPMLQAPVFLPNSISDSALSVQAEPPAPIATSKSAPAIAPPASVLADAGPSTPLPHRPFPMAKPLAAARMVHAYSPAKPSPLSRILMLANSPESPDIERPQLGALEVEMEGDEEDSPTPAATVAPPVLVPSKSLAEELGVSEGDDSPPALREREKTRVNAAKRTAPAVRPAAAPAPRVTAKEKGKAKAEPPKPAAATSRTRPAGTLEKENVKRAKLSAGSANGGTRAAAGKSTAPTKAPPKPFSKPAGAARSGPGGGGPRRVPIGSAEAAPMGRMWKG